MGDRGVRSAHRALRGVPGRRLRADRHGVRDRPDHPRLHRRHRPPARRDARADRAAARPLSRSQSRRAPAGAAAGTAPRLDEGARPDEGVGREPAALLQRAQGAAADEASRRPRRMDHRAPPRPVGDADEHPQGRDRPRPRRHRQAQPARRVDEGRGLGLPARQRRADARAVRAGLHVDRLRAVHARDRAGRGRPRRPLVVGDERAEGVRHALLDRARRVRARAARDPRRGSKTGHA